MRESTIYGRRRRERKGQDTNAVRTRYGGVNASMGVYAKVYAVTVRETTGYYEVGT